MNIARKKLGLIVCTKYRLSEDFSILGQMCFNSGYVDVYLKDTDEYIQLTVRRGTMFIDPDVVHMSKEMIISMFVPVNALVRHGVIKTSFIP